MTDTTWLKSLNFLQGGIIYLAFSAMVSNMGVGREGETYSWHICCDFRLGEREREGGEGREKVPD